MFIILYMVIFETTTKGTAIPYLFTLINFIMTNSIFLSKIAGREFFYIEQDGEFILYFLENGQRNFFSTGLFNSLESLISYYLFVTKQDSVNNKVLVLAVAIIESKSRPRSIESAIRKALIVFGVKEAMKKEEVIFSFVKVSTGEKRIARGTTNLDLIPADKRPTGSSTRKPNPLKISYFDIERNNYRSYLASNILY